MAREISPPEDSSLHEGTFPYLRGPATHTRVTLSPFFPMGTRDPHEGNFVPIFPPMGTRDPHEGNPVPIKKSPVRTRDPHEGNSVLTTVVRAPAIVRTRDCPYVFRRSRALRASDPRILHLRTEA